MTEPLVLSTAPARGTRSRAGNAMGRTRAALLAAAAACVAQQGVRRTTMADVAVMGGVAKATLYNHFRTKDDVLAALVEHEVAALARACAAAGGLEQALAAAALGVSTSAALRRVAAEEPALLGPLLQPGPAPAWELARAGVAAVLAQAGLAADAVQVAAVLRWLLGHALAPAPPEEAERAAALLAAGLRADAPPAAGTTVEVLDPAAPPAVAPEVTGPVEAAPT